MDIPPRIFAPAAEADLLRGESFEVFRGDPGNPFLAPRGVWLGPTHLIVADTGQNRVFVWNRLPEEPFQAPDLVLGQLAQADTGRNQGGTASASSLHYPSGLWSDGQRLIVADAWNHRVLIWLTFPTETGQTADVVLGQSSMDQNLPNREGITARPGAATLYWPYGVWSDGTQLWIADTGNRRVLHFARIPTENGAAADAVIGQPDMHSKDYESEWPVWPYSVKVSPDGRMAIADTQFFRIHLWSQWWDALHTPSELLIGQPDRQQNGQNQFRWKPGPNTLNWCYDSHFHGDGLWVADTGNSRLLQFRDWPTASNQSAHAVLGQPDFETGSENSQTVLGTESTMYWPFALSISGQQMAIADTGNHRVLFRALDENVSPKT